VAVKNKQMKLNNCYIATTILFLLFSNSYSQTNTIVQTPDIFKQFVSSKPTEGKIVLHQDDAIKTLINRFVEYRRKEAKIPGYRIRIFSDSGQTARQRANSERTRFSQLNPGITTYIEYEQPNFKIYVGDFRSRSEAFQFYKQIVKEFPKAFPVPTRINLPKI
jgi:hypothetical protein